MPRTMGIVSTASTKNRVPTSSKILPFDASTFSAMEANQYRRKAKT